MSDHEWNFTPRCTTVIHAGNHEESVEFLHERAAHGVDCEIVSTLSASWRDDLEVV